MPIIVLIPGLLCIFALLRGRTKAAFLEICIPVLVVLPTDYFWRAPHLPPISFVEATLFPLGIGMLLMDTSRWKLSRTDFWMVLFVFSNIYPQFRDRCKGDTCTTDWALTMFSTLTIALIPYMAGKLIIEQPGVRKETIRRFTWLLSIISVLSMPEFFTQVNVFRRFWIHFFPDEWQMLPTAARRGFGRLGGPYAGSEQAGMVLLFGVSFALWLHVSSFFARRKDCIGAPIPERVRVASSSSSSPRGKDSIRAPILEWVRVASFSTSSARGKDNIRAPIPERVRVASSSSSSARRKESIRAPIPERVRVASSSSFSARRKS